VAQPNCHACTSFRVTWDPTLPYECTAYGFRSKRLPSLVVRRTSGKDCDLFRPKPGRGADRD